MRIVEPCLEIFSTLDRPCQPAAIRSIDVSFCSSVDCRSGGISSLGISLPKVLAQQSASGNTRKDINCIFMFLQGGASHIDMYDMKPNMPSEVRGEYHPISTRVSGLQLCNHLPKLSECADKFSLIRSMQSYTSKHGEGDVHIMRRQSGRQKLAGSRFWGCDELAETAAGAGPAVRALR